MTVQESYAKMGADYDDVMSRLRTDDRIKRFLLRVADDQSFNNLVAALKEHNMEEVFRAAHTLKGVSSNLSLVRLCKSATAITEMLRGKTEYSADLEPMLEQVRADYELTIECIKSIE